MTKEEITKIVLQLDAMQKFEELVDLIMFLQTKNPKSIVELGTSNGGTTAALKICFPEATVIGVDWFLYPGFVEKQEKYGFKVIHGNCQEKETIEKVMDLVSGGKIDFLFIDADHSDENVRKDFTLWSPYAKMIGFHDIIKSPTRPDLQVYRLWNEEKKKRKYMEFIKPGDTWGGIGVLI